MKKTLTIMIVLIVLTSTVSAQSGFWNQVNGGGGSRRSNYSRGGYNDLSVVLVGVGNDELNRRHERNMKQMDVDMMERQATRVYGHQGSSSANPTNTVSLSQYNLLRQDKQDLQKLVEQLLQRIESLEATLSTPPPPQPTLAELVAKLSKAEKMQLMRELVAATK